MNYNGNYESVSTLAHEWGHALHSQLANQAQAFVNAGYSIFTAEVASTFQEALLLDRMLTESDSRQERIFFLGYALENLRGTFFRQTMFAEFELAIHEAVERGEALSGDRLTEMYGELVRRYHGHDESVVVIVEAYTVEWAYIPHFYYDFYVYQYATSVAASALLSERVLAGEDGAVERYLDLLRAGGSDYAYDLMKQAGVDLATPAPYRALLRRMEGIMDEIEALLDS
jgi:oligoendopeptidase F